MKTRKTFKYFLLFITAVILFLGFIAAPKVAEGYKIYKEATSQKPLHEAVNEIRSNDSYIKIQYISEEFLKQVVKSEDKRFYSHFGIDFISTARAMYCNLKAGSIVQGGSTITQQLAKNMYFTFEQTYERKIAELFVAFGLERNYTKDEILELYCNIAYFGEGCYGIKEASLHYFNVLPASLTVEQTSALVYTLKSPNNYNPNAY